jgi:hypothetical protein
MSGCALLLGGPKIRFFLLVEDVEFWSMKIDYKKIIDLQK